MVLRQSLKALYHLKTSADDNVTSPYVVLTICSVFEAIPFFNAKFNCISLLDICLHFTCNVVLELNGKYVGLIPLTLDLLGCACYGCVPRHSTHMYSTPVGCSRCHI